MTAKTYIPDCYCSAFSTLFYLYESCQTLNYIITTAFLPWLFVKVMARSFVKVFWSQANTQLAH